MYRPALSNMAATCDYRALEQWLVQTEMCCNCKIHTWFQRLHILKKHVKYIYDYMLKK